MRDRDLLIIHISQGHVQFSRLMEQLFNAGCSNEEQKKLISMNLHFIAIQQGLLELDGKPALVREVPKINQPKRRLPTTDAGFYRHNNDLVKVGQNTRGVPFRYTCKRAEVVYFAECLAQSRENRRILKRCHLIETMEKNGSILQDHKIYAIVDWFQEIRVLQRVSGFWFETSEPDLILETVQESLSSLPPLNPEWRQGENQ